MRPAVRVIPAIPPSVVRFGSALLLASAAPAAARVIDTFETGGFSATITAPDVLNLYQQPDPAHCIAPERRVNLQYHQGTTGTLHCELVPLDGEDDAIEASFPDGIGRVMLMYEGGPWDLTDGGMHDRVVVNVVDAPTGVFVLSLRDAADQLRTHLVQVSGQGAYQFPYSSFDLDPTSIIQIHLSWSGEPGQTGSIRAIRTGSLMSSVLFQAWEPRTFVLQCAAAQPGPRSGGEHRLGWDWTPDWPAAPTIAGPVLEVTHLSAPGCVDVGFESAPDGGAGLGHMGLVTVDWLASTFSSASFELRFATDPTAPYTAQLVDGPVITQNARSLVVTHAVAVSGAPGVPDGVVRQETIVSVHPAQGATFAYGEAAPETGNGNGEGCTLQFVVSGGAYTPASPLLEIFTSADYADDAGATSAPAASAATGGRAALSAHPSVTRSGVRFVLPSGSPEGAAVHVFDVAGRRVRTLASAAGEARWDGAGADGVRAPAGVYFGRSPASEGTARVVLLR